MASRQINPPQREQNLLRSLLYFVNRWILHRQFLVARVPTLGLRFKVKTEDVVGRHLYKYHIHEPEISAILFEHLRIESGDVIFDIGANVGWYSVLLSKIVPQNVTIFSFEPDPLNFSLLEHNVDLNDSSCVVPVQMAVADQKGSQTLYRYSERNLGRHSLLPINEGESVEVQTTTLDGFWEDRQLGMRVPSFIKIDIEGYELFALRGAKKVLANCRAVLTEYSPDIMRGAGLDPDQLLSLLLGQGFSPHKIDVSGLIPLKHEELREISGVTDIFWSK